MKKMTFVGVFLMLFVLSSCINTKKMVCLENMREDYSYQMNVQADMTVQRDDRLSIVVNSRNPELAAPFNISTGETYRVTDTGEVTSPARTVGEEKGYTVDLNGCIEFPILGKLKVADLTRKQVANLIKERLTSENLISDPLVFVDILNFKVTVMGAVVNPGVLEVKDSRITLLEAITRAKGLSPNATMDKVAVIREEGDERRMYMHDVRSTDIFYSPCYYLRQNDIVYVQPKFAEATVKEERTLGFFSLILGVITSAISLGILLK